MSKSMQNNSENHMGGNSNHGRGSGEQALCNVNFGEMPPIPPELDNNIRNLNY